MRELDDTKEMLVEQLKKINRKGDAITPQDLDCIYKIVDIMKDIAEIENKSNSYSNGWNYGMTNSYNSYNGNGNSNDNYMGGNSSRMPRYSSEDEKEHMKQTLESLRMKLDRMN